ncbi:MAG: hypothetical protein JO184_01725 [Gammaproteobacteria bacterium]|nr:hypothetical protein [Gammaproteobacteria bacterium]
MSKPIYNLIYAFLAVVLTVPIVGGASGPPSSGDTERKASEFIAPPDKSLVYIYRSKSLFAAAVPMRVTLDGSRGFIGVSDFLVRAVEPGTHVVLIEMPPPNVSKITALIAPPKAPTPAEVTFDTKPGETYFLHATPAMGFSSGKIGERFDPPETGEKAVAGARRAEWVTEAPALAASTATSTQPASTTASALSLAAWGPRWATPGTQLQLIEAERRPAKSGDPVPATALGCTMLTYFIVGSGFPPSVDLAVRTKWGYEKEPFVSQLHARSDSAGRVGADPKIVMPVGCFPKGLSWDIGLVSADGSARGLAEVVPFPIEGRDGPCHVAVTLFNVELFTAAGDGFPPKSPVEVTLQSDDESLPSRQVQTSDSGETGYMIIAPATKKGGHHASVTMKGDSCKVRVEYLWGQPAAALQ